jgi:hypothetical protein
MKRAIWRLVASGMKREEKLQESRKSKNYCRSPLSRNPPVVTGAPPTSWIYRSDRIHYMLCIDQPCLPIRFTFISLYNFIDLAYYFLTCLPINLKVQMHTPPRRVLKSPLSSNNRQRSTSGPKSSPHDGQVGCFASFEGKRAELTPNAVRGRISLRYLLQIFLLSSLKLLTPP